MAIAAVDADDRVHQLILLTERLTDLAGRLFFDTAPTLSAIGPVEHLVSLDEIAGALTHQPVGARKAVG